MVSSAKVELSPLPEASGVAVRIVAPWDRLPMTFRLAQPMTDDALFEFCAVHRDLRIERTPKGEIVIMSPTGPETGRRNSALAVALGTWATRDGTGVVFDSSTGFLLPNGALRSPDAAWMRRSRWEALAPEQRERFAPVCPDFVAEMRSPSDRLDDVQAKLREYMECGASLGWLIDLLERRVYVFRPGAAPKCLDRPAAILGDPVLPGFVLDTESIW